MISLNKTKRRKLTGDELEKMGYDPISDYDRSLAQVEDLLCMTTSCDKKPSLFETHRTQFWNEVVTHLDIDESRYHDFILSRYYISEIYSDCGADKYSNVKRIQEPGCNTLNQREEVPKAWLDMMDKSNMFPRKGAHSLHRLYGLKDFVVMSVKDSKICLNMAHRFLKTLSRVANKCQSQIPVFVDCSDSLYIGFLESDGFRTFFTTWKVSKPSKRQLNMNNIDGMKYNLTLEEYQFQHPSKITTLSYCIDLKESCKEHTPDLTSTDDFKKCEDHWYDNNIRLYLNATWSEQLKTVVTGCGIGTDLDPLDAPEWSVRAKIAEKSEAELGDCLKKFLSLCSDSSPSNTKNLTKRTCKQRKEIKVRKVPSKSTLKPQESIIPLKSYNAILEFLFRDAKLQPFQHSNGSNPSTTTTVEDEVEDKFFLSYKEPSKYFKSAQPYGLLSRLAICLCIVNKYHGGLGAVTRLWGEFVLRMKHCLENNYEIRGLEPDEPKVDSELLQKLQVLNSCIRKKKASSPITDTSNESIDEHKERDKITNEIKRIKTSHGMRPIFKKRIQEFPDDDAKKVLDWLDLVKPSELVLSLMPMLIHSAITSLLKHSVCQLDFLREDLNQFRNKLIHNEASQFTSGIKMFEDHIHQLTIIEQKMAIAQYLLKKFREVDPSNDAELQKYIAELVKSREVPIDAPTGKLPSETSFGKLVCDLFCIDYETRKAGFDPENGVIGLGPYFKEYNSILDCSKTTGLRLRLRCIVHPKRLQFAAAYICKAQIPCFAWSD